MLVHDIIKIKYTREGYLQDYPPHLISDIEMFDAFLKIQTDDNQDVGVVFQSLIDANSWESLKDAISTGFKGQFIDSYMMKSIDIFIEENSVYESITYEIDAWQHTDNIVSMIPHAELLSVENSIYLLLSSLYFYTQRIISELKSGVIPFPLPNWVYAYMLEEPIYSGSAVKDIKDLTTALHTDNIYDVYTVKTFKQNLKVSQLWISKLPSTQKRVPTIFGESHVVKALRIYDESIVS